MINEEYKNIWELVLAEFRERYSSTTVNLWFADIEPIEISETKAVLGFSVKYKMSIVSSKYAEEIREILGGILGFDVELKFICTDNGAPVETLIKPEPKPKAENKQLARQTEYTFENFVEGSSNKLAYAACFAVASSAGEENHDHINDMYNPLFVYGASGLGKTHLMYSIKNKVEKEFPHVSIIYTKGEEFMNQMVEALKNKTTAEFREKYRLADMLIIDDIQFISNKPGIQEEIFHTFNYLYEDNKQIIFTSDRPPKDINPLVERLRTRFEQSMIADIQPPDIELRMAIIKQKAANLGIPVSNEVITYMADRLKSNVRQVEGALKKIAALSFLSGTSITLETARAAVSDLLDESEPQNVVTEKVFSAVSTKYGVSVADLKGTSQSAKTVNARNVAIYLLRSLTDMKLEAIGALFGRTHSTINHSLSKVENMITNYSAFEEEINELVADIKG
ncbi:MAG: chromosomal replication initiator protein DnaA [Clostridia bacterium]|nr:chromosomal replication initiator protein DnaA [Clostridia bacterium]